MEYMEVAQRKDGIVLIRERSRPTPTASAHSAMRNWQSFFLKTQNAIVAIFSVQIN